MRSRQDNFPGDIEEVLRRDAGVVEPINIDLSIVATDQPYDISGNMFYIWSAPDGTYIDIKVNETRKTAISYVEQTGQETPFKRLYITTPAGQTGNLVLLYGTEAPDLARMLDNRGSISGDLATIRDELRGDTTPENWGTEKTVGNGAAVEIIASSANRKDCFVQAKAVNTGIIYIGFDNTVATNKWVAQLTAGMGWGVDDYRGDIYARADAAGQLLGWGEW